MIEAEQMPQRSPNFFVPGTQKAGTTYLCAQLARHPDVYISELKEPMFFNSRNFDAGNARRYLENHFSEAQREKWVGEGSTLYFQDREAPRRIRDVFGADLKFIICLRHPVEKALSLYMHNFRRGRLNGNEAINSLQEGPFAVKPLCLISEAAKRYVKLFGREKLKFLKYDVLRRDPSSFVRLATDFLQVPPIQTVSSTRINAGNVLEWRDGFLTPNNEGLVLSKSQVNPKFSPGELKELHNQFFIDIKRAEELLRLDLSEWYSFPSFK